MKVFAPHPSGQRFDSPTLVNGATVYLSPILAYAYFLLPKRAVLDTSARKRLRAIEEILRCSARRLAPQAHLPAERLHAARLIGKVEQKGHTLVPVNLHWKNGKIKCEIALAKGKAEHDKRDTIKDREGKREVERAMKSRSR